MKYLSVEELRQLTDKELDDYANSMTAYQIKLMAVMDIWIDYYNITSDEYDRRNPKKYTIVNTDSVTKH